MSSSDRKAELERKKARLQAMRDEKKRKEELKRKEVSFVNPIFVFPGFDTDS